MKQKSKLLLPILAVVLLAGLMLGIWSVLSPASTAGSKTITVEVTHLDGSFNSFTVETDEEFLGPALEQAELISGSQGDYGLFIDTVDGERADSGRKQWWTFTVNGEHGNYGADLQPISDGDIYAFSIYVG